MIKTTSAVLLTALLASACANMNETQRGTATGAGIGAGLGAVLGAATGPGGSGRAATGAVLGGAVGAVPGLDRPHLGGDQVGFGPGMGRWSVNSSHVLAVPSELRRRSQQGCGKSAMDRRRARYTERHVRRYAFARECPRLGHVREIPGAAARLGPDPAGASRRR